MLYFTTKNTLWLFLATTFSLLVFQRVAVEVVHQITHLVEGTHHFHFHQLSVDHTHKGLVQTVEARPNNTKKVPISTSESNLPALLAVIITNINGVISNFTTSTLFIKTFRLPHSVFLESESPPPDYLIG